MTAVKTTLLLLTFAQFQFFTRCSAAHPVVFYDAHATNRLGPHSVPVPPVGDKVQIFVALNSNDPIGSPTISVEAVQGGTSLMLDPVGDLGPLFDGYHVYYKFIDFDPGLIGPWQIIATDSEGIGPLTFTNAINEPEFVPLVEDVAVQGTSLGATVSWTLPNLSGFDVDGIGVRVIEATSGRHMWNSDLLPLETTSFTAPPGVLQVGVDYVYWVSLSDYEGSDEENVSFTFSQPFRFTTLTTSGDFNLDGAVDAADYVVWRKELGKIYDQDDYDTWQSNFGTSLGPGTGSSLPSTEPDPAPGETGFRVPAAAVPEPATLIMMIMATVGCVFISAALRKSQQLINA